MYAAPSQQQVNLRDLWKKSLVLLTLVQQVSTRNRPDNTPLRICRNSILIHKYDNVMLGQCTVLYTDTK